MIGYPDWIRNDTALLEHYRGLAVEPNAFAARASSMLQDAVQKRASGGLLQAACLVRQNAHFGDKLPPQSATRYARVPFAPFSFFYRSQFPSLPPSLPSSPLLSPPLLLA